MEQLLAVNNDTQTVSARELHKRLNIKSKYADWFKNMIAYGFTEGTDFTTISKNLENGGRTIEHDITIDMAKQICMIQRTPEGKQCRQYLIDLEKAWNTPEQIFARALKMADNTIKGLKVQIEDMKPKAQFFDAVADSKTAISMNECSKVLAVKGYGRNKLFEFLRAEKVLQKNNVPYQKYVDAGWFRVIEQHYQKNGEPVVTTKTLVYQKGVDGIRKMLLGGENESKCISTESSAHPWH